MAYENLIVIDRGPIRVIQINRPKTLNALNRTVLRELDHALDDLEAHTATRCAVITGAGDKAFVAGADVSEMKSLSPVEAERFSDLGHRVMDKIETLRVPVIAAVNGFALGGGLELALACDFVYASENARLGLVEASLGLIPGFGGTTRLVREVSIGHARELIYTAKKLKADEALRLGLVNKVVDGDVVEEAVKAGEKIAKNGPVAISLAKRVLTHTQDCDHRTANAMERHCFGLVFATDDHLEGMTALLEKREAHFKGK